MQKTVRVGRSTVLFLSGRSRQSSSHHRTRRECRRGRPNGFKGREFNKKKKKEKAKPRFCRCRHVAPFTRVYRVKRGKAGEGESDAVGSAAGGT